MSALNPQPVTIREQKFFEGQLSSFLPVILFLNSNHARSVQKLDQAYLFDKSAVILFILCCKIINYHVKPGAVKFLRKYFISNKIRILKG